MLWAMTFLCPMTSCTETYALKVLQPTSFNCKKERILQYCTDTKPHGSNKISVNSTEFVACFFAIQFNAFNAYLNVRYFIIYLIHSSTSGAS